MEYVGQQNIKKLCNFYVSELHLSVMLAPYLRKQINGDVEITTIFEKLKKEKFEKMLDKLNIENRNEKVNINWLNNNESSATEIESFIENSIKKNKKNVIIICGNREYISNNNSKITEILRGKSNINNVKIIDCYNVEEIGEEMRSIVKKYDGIMNTSGEVEIEDLLSTY